MISECLFGAWKRHFPILKNLRTHCELSQKVILATSVLFNLARMLEDDFNEEDIDDKVSEDHDAPEYIIVEDRAPTIKMRGQIFRDQLKDAMPN